MLIRARMTMELVSEKGGRCYRMRPRALGKLLHMARQEGWEPERVPHEWPSDSWETEIILPHLGPYMPGRVSRADAEGLRIALTRALATGTVAAEGAQIATGILLQVARDGAFQVRLVRTESFEPQPLFSTVPA